eukprot:1155021-Pyramimonas_sp.AAC.1
MRARGDGIFNHGIWVPFYEPKKNDASKMCKAPLRTIDSRHSRQSDGAFVLRMQKELGSMFSDLLRARCAQTCLANARPTIDPALQPPSVRRVFLNAWRTANYDVRRAVHILRAKTSFRIPTDRLTAVNNASSSGAAGSSGAAVSRPHAAGDHPSNGGGKT